jgi:hypothetical protein
VNATAATPDTIPCPAPAGLEAPSLDAAVDILEELDRAVRAGRMTVTAATTRAFIVGQRFAKDRPLRGGVL